GRVGDSETMAPSDARRAIPRFQRENFASNRGLVGALERIAAAHGCTPAQVALAWLLARNIVPIPGTKRLACLDENLGAADIALSEAETAALEQAFVPDVVAGSRCSEAAMRYIEA